MAATTGIVQLLSERELRGVMAHELAHVKHRDILISTISATMAGAIGMLANFAMFFGGRSGDGRPHNPLASILVAILAPLAASLIQMAISRAREFEADRGGAEISGDPQALASALQKIHHYAQGIPLMAAERHPETAQMMIMNPLSGGGLRGLVLDPPVDRRARRAPAGDGGAPLSGRRRAQVGAAAADTGGVLVNVGPAMHARLSVALLLAAVGAAGCNLFGSEAAEAAAARREADGKAVGGACRHAGRAIEDCYTLNRRADKSAVYAGWREMNDYMRENKLEPVAPQLGAETVAQAADGEAKKGSRGAAERAPERAADKTADKAADKPADKSADKPRSKDSGTVVNEKSRKSDS